MNSQTSKAKAGRARRGWLVRNGVKLVIIAVFVGALTLIGMIPPRTETLETTVAPPVNVAVVTVQAEPRLADTFDLPGTVEPNEIVTISAEVEGRVESTPLEKGSPVKAGDLLVGLNTDLMQPLFESAEAQLKRDETFFQRIARLAADNATSETDLDNATMQLAISRARLAEARARLDRSQIVSPVSGMLNDLHVEDGEYVQVGTPVAQVVDTRTVKVVVDVPERDVGYFVVGRQAEVFVNTQGEPPSVTGKISFISELADAQTHSTRMEIKLANPDAVLRSGQIVRVRLTRRILQDVILIPLQAVIPMEDGRAVYVVESGAAQRRDVVLGIIRDDAVEVRRGLANGERLIVAGHRFVAPGQNVSVIGETP